MPVVIRLSRVGTKHVPMFRLVVADSRKKRDGAILENIGTYDAEKTELVRFDAERYDAWVKVGAQPSDTAKKLYRLFKKHGVKNAAQSVEQVSAEEKPARKPRVKKADKTEAVESKA